MIYKYKILVVFFCFCFNFICAQTAPSINPEAIIVKDNGEREHIESYQGSAPLTVEFKANSSQTLGWDAHYKWIFSEGGSNSPYLIRYEENTGYTFTKSGTHNVILYATFTKNNDTIAYAKEYWGNNVPFKISISTSKLEMPNAFSPNGDGINDTYKAKEGYRSIVSFRAIIFNRFGQKVFEWSDPSQGWDGKYRGKDVKAGVYFVLVEAQGADGYKYKIKKDVNLLREYTETSGSTLP